ncbi:MAG: hypothetical protein Ct9H300mP14_12600 [Gammaproteobacteria bacterium]|nr:MAG: hypothetical protein Ct9H300mP14_12600 [Gammaproteobacteria bacterium]
MEATESFSRTSSSDLRGCEDDPGGCCCDLWAGCCHRGGGPRSWYAWHRCRPGGCALAAGDQQPGKDQIRAMVSDPRQRQALIREGKRV